MNELKFFFLKKNSFIFNSRIKYTKNLRGHLINFFLMEQMPNLMGFNHSNQCLKDVEWLFTVIAFSRV